MTACTYTRLLVNAPPTYDFAHGVLTTGLWIDAGGLAGNSVEAVGAVTMPPGIKQMNLSYITGRLEGTAPFPDTAYLNGIVLNMTNAYSGVFDVANDPARVRGIIGTITSTSNGSVRGIHLTIVGQGAAAISGVLMQMQPAASSFATRAFLVEALGAPGMVEGYYVYSGPGSDAKFGLATYDASFTDAAIVMKTGITNGKIRWTDGGYITSRATSIGIVEQGGVLRKLNAESLSWRNAANDQDLEALQVDNSNSLRLGFGTAGIRWGKPAVALGGGAAATFGTVGATGPGGAAQTGWLPVIDTAGITRFIPLFT